MSLRACPDCGGSLGVGAIKCRCGWTAGKSASFQKVDCAYIACLMPARIKEKTPTGWANFCIHHAREEHTKRAEKWCHEHGLQTLEDKIGFCRSQFPGLIRIPVEREPGCDDA